MKKTMLITGSSSGVGEATAKLFAERGFNVVATMRSPEKSKILDNTPNLIKERLDVEDTESIDHAIKVAVEKFGRIDLVINNAGYGQYGVFEGTSIEKIRKNFDVNVFGYMNVMQRIIPVFRQQGGGIILNVGSCGGIFGLPLSSSYISTKFALEALSNRSPTSWPLNISSQNFLSRVGLLHRSMHAPQRKTQATAECQVMTPSSPPQMLRWKSWLLARLRRKQWRKISSRQPLTELIGFATASLMALSIWSKHGES